MAINPLIALQGQVPSVAQGIEIFDQERERQRLQGATDAANALRAQQLKASQAATEGARISNMDARNTARLKSLVMGAARLAPVLARGDTDTAMQILQQRRQSLAEQGVDTSDTSEAIAMLEQGNVQGLTQSVGDALKIGQQMGLLGASTKNFQALTPQTVRVTDEQGNPINQIVVPIVDKRNSTVNRVVLGRSAELTPAEQLQQELRALEAKAQVEAQTPQGQAALAKTRAETQTAQVKAQQQQTQVRKAQEVKSRALEVIDRLLSPQTADALESATGSIQGRLPSVFQSTVNVENDIELLRNLLTTENLDLMKGVLSESDVRMLKNLSAGGLELTSGTERVRNALSRMKEALSNQLGVQTQGADLSPDEIQELETLRQQQGL